MRTMLIALVGLALAMPTTLQADIFDNPENLEVLSEDISPGQLRATMRSFAMGTGQRCSNCHVGEEGADLSTYDFASDEKEEKRIAREMLKMTMAINRDFLDPIEKDHVQVTCITCHRGVKHPRMTGEVLEQAAEKGGSEGLTRTYRDLRGRYYGTHSYDFSDRTLAAVAQGLLQGGKPDEAVTMLDLMLEDDPDSFNANFLYGEISAGRGDRSAAAEYYRKAMEINPQAAGFLQPKLDALQEE